MGVMLRLLQPSSEFPASVTIMLTPPPALEPGADPVDVPPLSLDVPPPSEELAPPERPPTPLPGLPALQARAKTAAHADAPPQRNVTLVLMLG
jgi:hypothetical protein